MKEHAVGQGTKPWIRLDSKRKILIQGTVCKEKKLHADLGHRLFQQYSVKPGTHGLGTPKLKQMGVHETGSTHFLFSPRPLAPWRAIWRMRLFGLPQNVQVSL
jgi:hypothetical protein